MYLPSEVSLAVIEGHYGWRAKKNRWCFTVVGVCEMHHGDKQATDAAQESPESEANVCQRYNHFVKSGCVGDRPTWQFRLTGTTGVVLQWHR